MARPTYCGHLYLLVTLEHGRLLQEQHGMAHAQLARAVHTMRRRGVRRENVRLNTELTPSLANTDLGLHPCAY